MKTITATTPATSEAAIINLKVGNVIKVPGYCAEVTVTAIDYRFTSLWPVVFTTGKTDEGCTLTAEYRSGGFVLTDRSDSTRHHVHTIKVAA